MFCVDGSVWWCVTVECFCVCLCLCVSGGFGSVCVCVCVWVLCLHLGTRGRGCHCSGQFLEEVSKKCSFRPRSGDGKREPGRWFTHSAGSV